jgi:hypothetical protein
MNEVKILGFHLYQENRIPSDSINEMREIREEKF